MTNGDIYTLICTIEHAPFRFASLSFRNLPVCYTLPLIQFLRINALCKEMKPRCNVKADYILGKPS